ncbi:MAG TPA: Spy/CpxP family protein refolding chaperone [Steroidobacteraceae bacterium]|nr:Spy/CpxP family protein refolding chaperone [Steroidobacteraceae bacterium]
MKTTHKRVLIALAVAMLGAGAAGTASAQQSPAGTSATPDPSAAGSDEHPGHIRGRGEFERRGHFRHHGHFRRHRHFMVRGLRAGDGGAPFVSSLLRATHRLDLTPEQRSSIRTILASARPAAGSAAQPHPDVTVLGNPGDRNYASAVQGAQAAAASRIQKESTVARQIYAVLTPAQQQQLPTVLAAMKARGTGRGSWAGRRSGDNG